MIGPSPSALREHDESTTPTLHWVLRVARDGSDPRFQNAIVASDERLDVVVAGELFDLEALATLGNVPASLPAARIARAAWLQQGERLLPRLRGRFALAVAERQARVARVVRDPLGAYPLFYALTPRDVIFSSAIQALRQQPDVSNALNRPALADHLCKRWPDRQETFFEQIRRVPAGWQAIVSARGLILERYWHPVGERIDWMPDEEIAAFDGLLDQAVARGLSRGRAGIFLSGGFDSVSVAAVAADLTRRTHEPAPLALSLGFPDPACDEQPVQTSVARSLGLPIHLLGFFEAAGARGLLAEGLDLTRQLSAPLLNSWMPAYLSLARRATLDGVRTILTGEGGDEWLGTSPFLAADLIRRGDIRGLVQIARTWQRSYHQTWLTVIRGTLWRYGLRPLLGAACSTLSPDRWDARRAAKSAAASPDWVAPDHLLRSTQLARLRASIAEARPVGGFYERESKIFLDLSLTSWLFEEQHEVGSPLGLAYVHPYWDADLVAHVYRVRPERLNEHNRTKALVRQTVARRFPALGFERQRKVAAMDFFASILRNEGPVLGETVADFRGLASLGVVAPEGARRFMRTAWGQDALQLGMAWNLVNAEVWVRQQIGLD
ncbi:MAG: asparagine synthase-related protein [Acidobacteriota bacterium]